MTDQTIDTTVMTPNHPQWSTFCERLDGPEGIDSRMDDDGDFAWTCDGGRDKSKATAILQTMSGIDVAASLEYFESRGGYCDCEILLNIAALEHLQPMATEAELFDETESPFVLEEPPWMRTNDTPTSAPNAVEPWYNVLTEDQKVAAVEAWIKTMEGLRDTPPRDVVRILAKQGWDWGFIARSMRVTLDAPDEWAEVSWEDVAAIAGGMDYETHI